MDDNQFVLGIHPTTRGFGWALFESATSPFDWGSVEARGEKHKNTLARLGALLERYQPAVLVMEQFEGEASRRSRRIRRLASTMTALAKARNIKVAIFTRAEIAAALSGSGGRTREEIAQFVANNVGALRDRLPAKRKIWESERPNLALFSAAACALTWFANKQ